MARVDEKARYYLERSVPQLREFESKEIFNKEEIRMLVQKRTEFERIVLSPGSKPTDVLNYIAWDQQMDRLRAKRCTRLNIKQSSGHASQGRIFQTFERGVTKHPGSTLLWRRYLEFAAQAKATKRWRGIMTRALRLLPSDGELWVIAGRKSVRDGDMEGARSYFMRGCRFCTGSSATSSSLLVWTEYARVELEWLQKFEAKGGKKNSEITSLVAESRKKKGNNVYEEGEGLAFDDDDDDDSDDNEGDFSNAVVLPKHLTDDPAAQAKPEVFSDDAIAKLKATPALEGAIPRAIFDGATQQPFFNADAGEAFFDVFVAFQGKVAAQPALVQHAVDVLSGKYAAEPATWNCRVKQPLLGLDADSAAFPRALRTSLVQLWEGMDAMKTPTTKSRLAAKATAWVDVLVSRQGLDAGLHAVLVDTRRKLQRAAGVEEEE